MFWQNYTSLCNERGISANEAARECGVKSSGTVTGWKNGALPRQNVLKKIADYFNCSVEDLISDKKTPATKSDESVSYSTVNREELKRLVDRLTDKEVSDYLADFRRTILGE